MMKIWRPLFFDAVHDLFAGGMQPSQRDGLLWLLDAGDTWPDDRQLAYILATTYHETARTMEPIAEYGQGAGKAYGIAADNGQVYYGRGYVQLTWQRNYQKQDDKLGLGGSLVANADLALAHDVARDILFKGMRDGDFTGVRLDRYVGQGTDFFNARRVVNGLDCAGQIEEAAWTFLAAITRTDPGT